MIGAISVFLLCKAFVIIIAVFGILLNRNSISVQYNRGSISVLIVEAVLVFILVEVVLVFVIVLFSYGVSYISITNC